LEDVTLLEVSYEVANKVGGIYTVLVSKMSYAIDNAKTYYAVGPYYQKSAASEFKQESPPNDMKAVFDDVERTHGIRCYYGRWLVEKGPRTILVDPHKLREKTNDVKFRLWEEHKIDSWQTDDWFNDPVVWSKATGIVIQKLVESGFLKGNVVVHFHEWLSGAGLLHLKSNNVKAATVFTTHSTVLGRTIAETGREDLYEIINAGFEKGGINPDQKAYEYNVHAKHMMEKATAVNANVFTTVSEIMARECQFVLGRKPDVILSNGLDMNKFPPMENVFKIHDKYRHRLRDFLLGYFLPYYETEMDDALVCFISGRYEFRNKGIDIFIGALGKVNERLKKSGNGKNIVAFIWIPAETRGRKPTVVEHLRLLEDLDEIVEGEKGRIEKDVLKAFLSGKPQKKCGVFDEEFLNKLKELGTRLKKKEAGNPPITPFDMASENSITSALVKNGLLNRKSDRVKVIYYPVYLSVKDGLLGIDYYNAMAACDVGIFPSYYESWGYTPLETAALGMQAVTTDLSGYGRFIKSYLQNGETSISVIHRDKKPDSSAVRELEEILLRIYGMSPEERLKDCRRAKELSMLADWSRLFENYVRAYEMALKLH